MKSRIALLLALVFCLLAVAGCTTDTGNNTGSDTTTEPATATETEKLVVGLDDTFAPMGFRDTDGTLVGFDVDLATAVGEEMGVEVVFQPIDWKSKEMELEAGTIDCAWNGMSRTPERETNMTLSQDYLNNKLIVMTNKGVSIATKEDMKNYNIGIQAGSSALEVVTADDIYDTIKDVISEYQTYDEIILDMQAGRIDAMVVDEVLGQYKNNQLDADKKLEVSAVDFGDDLYCIGFKKGNTDLCGRVEAAMKKVQESGKGAEISNKWFGENLMLEIK